MALNLHIQRAQLRASGVTNQTRVDRDKPRNLEFGLWFMDFFDGLWITPGYQLDHLLSCTKTHKFLETAQSPNSSFPFLLDLGLDLALGLGLVNITSQPDRAMIDRLKLHSKPTIVNYKSKTRWKLWPSRRENQTENAPNENFWSSRQFLKLKGGGRGSSYISRHTKYIQVPLFRNCFNVNVHELS